MTIDIETIKKINNAHGIQRKSEPALFEIKRDIQEHFEDTIDYTVCTVNGQTQGLLVVHTTANNTKKVLSRPDETFYLGDVIGWLDHDWLVTSRDADTQLYTRGTMTLCNYTLKWRSPTGTLLAHPCVIGNQSMDDKEFAARQIAVGDTRLIIKLPYCTDTLAIRPGQRFLIDHTTHTPTAFRVSYIDNISLYDDGHGVIQLTVIQDMYNPTTDNKERMIADYWPEPESPENAILQYQGDPVLRIGGKAKRFTLSNNDGSAVWELILPPPIEHRHFLVRSDGAGCSVQVNASLPLSVTPLHITLCVTTTEQTIQQPIKVVGLTG